VVASLDRERLGAEELRDDKGHLGLLATVGVILPVEGDELLLEGQQAMIGNGHTTGVTSQIAHHLREPAKEEGQRHDGDVYSSGIYPHSACG